MAKKKSDGAAKGGSAKTPAAPAAKTPAAKTPAAPTPQATTPPIDTSAAANVAAAMIGSKAARPQPTAQAPRQESAAFKQLKAGLNKPTGTGLGGAFGAVQQNRKSQQNYGGGKQIGRNQASDVKRTGVPRRTPG